MGNLFKRSTSEQLFFDTHPLEPGEVVAHTWVASTIFLGIFAKHGGNLILTNQRLLFEPLKMPLLQLSQIPVVGPILKYISVFADTQGSAMLSEIARAEAIPGRPPRLRVVSKQSTAADFFVVVDRRRSIWSKNQKARDTAVEEINRAINKGSGMSAGAASSEVT
jgi:hypothetical protein